MCIPLGGWEREGGRNEERKRSRERKWSMI